MQNLWESYSDEVKATAPRFCPGCGEEFVVGSKDSVVALVALEAEERTGTETAWDCCCAACGWSGDIRKDSKLLPTKVE